MWCAGNRAQRRALRERARHAGRATHIPSNLRDKGNATACEHTGNVCGLRRTGAMRAWHTGGRAVGTTGRAHFSSSIVDIGKKGKRWLSRAALSHEVTWDRWVYALYYNIIIIQTPLLYVTLGSVSPGIRQQRAHTTKWTDAILFIRVINAPLSGICAFAHYGAGPLECVLRRTGPARCRNARRGDRIACPTLPYGSCGSS